MTKLLIVDDNEQNLYMLQMLLVGNGDEVQCATNGAEALTIARDNPPDMIITDILMPVMDGFALCREWKKDARLSTIPFVFYTATYTDPKDEEFATNLGADRFITKPQEPDVFVRKIGEVIAERGAGHLSPPSEPQADEAVCFQQYNEALIRKLEDRMVKIEEAKRRLECEVAERARVEEALRRSEKELRARHHVAGAFLTVRDDDVYAEVLRIVLDALESEFGVFGYIDEDGALIAPSLTRDVWDKCMVPDKNVVFPRETWGDSIWARAIEQQKAFHLNEPSTRTPEGHITITRVIAVPIVDQGCTIGLLQVANKKEDYTEEDIRLLESIGSTVAPILKARLQRDLEEKKRSVVEGQLRQAQKMEAIGQLAGGVAHDFNNVLQVILGYTSLVVDAASLSAEDRSSLLEVTKAAEHAAGLTRQLLAFGRRQVLAREDVDLNSVVAGLLKMIRRVISEDIQLDFSPGPDLGAVHVDPGQIEQVVLDICINARDAMPDGGQLTLETENVVLDDAYCEINPWAQPGSYIALKISDTGEGMDETTQKQIFEPFFTTKELGRGTGLGLATVYGIVKQHDGFIHVYSEVGNGTVFKIHFPAVPRSAGELQPDDRGPIHGGTETILFAEDNSAIRTLGARILENAGYTVHTAASGEEALAVFHEHADAITLAVLDVVMPKMGGQAASDQIRAISPEMHFLFTSGYGASGIHARFNLAEGAKLIQKPYEPNLLLRKVREVLDAPATP